MKFLYERQKKVVEVNQKNIKPYLQDQINVLHLIISGLRREILSQLHISQCPKSSSSNNSLQTLPISVEFLYEKTGPFTHTQNSWSVFHEKLQRRYFVHWEVEQTQ